MEHLRYFAELIAGLMAAIVLPFLIVVALRSHRIPECFSCGAMKMRPSRIVGFWDSLFSAFQILPYRCSGCRERFYALRLFGTSRKPSTVQVEQRHRVITVAFRFRHGLLNRIAIRVTDLRPERTHPASAMLQI